jgi:DNA-binding HxlR family transcriptional regulator
MSDAGSLCPRFHLAVELVGGRWTGAIIQCLLGGRARYNAIRTAVPEISDRMLSERLRALETEGVVTRTVVPESPVRVEYELTAKGRALQESIDAIGKWANRWISEEDLDRARAGNATPSRRNAGRAKSKRPARARTSTRRR